MSTATIVKNAVSVVPSETRDGYLTVNCPQGWVDVEKLVSKVLEFEGKKFTFTGWNSDRNVAFFKSGGAFASISDK